ncbi:hypothetical protein QQ045_032407 [Rhodiola kirilowii]
MDSAPPPISSAVERKKAKRKAKSKEKHRKPQKEVEEGEILCEVEVGGDAGSEAEVGTEAKCEVEVEEDGGVGGRSFEEVAKDFWRVRNEQNRSTVAGTKLRFHSELLGADKIPCSEEEWVECAGAWAWALVGIVFGFKPSLGRMKSFVRTRWGDENLVTVAQMKPGVFLFNFSSQEEMARVQEQGPWTMDNKPVILQCWTPDETFDLESVESIPIWVRFPGLPPHMRKEPLLSKIASSIGNPIRTDGFTSCGDKLMYARVLIEVYVTMDFKKAVTVQGPRGVNYVQKVQYEWLPPRCSHCQRFGHSVAQCALPMLKVVGDEEEEVDRVIIEPEMSREREKIVDVPLEVLMRNAVVAGSVACSSSTSVVPETDTDPSIREESGRETNVETDSNKGILSASEQAAVESTEDSKNSDDRLGNWNVRGINNPAKQNEVRSLIQKFNIGLLAILEAKVRVDGRSRIIGRCVPNASWKSFCLEPGVGRKSKILLIWNPDSFDVSVWFASEQIIICDVTWNGIQTMVGFVYAQNSQRLRRDLWDDVSDAMGRVNSPWMLLGDFNCICSQEEKLNGAMVREADTKELSDFINQTGLSDIVSSGSFFTWSDKHQQGKRIWCKLDRILCNDSFISKFPSVYGFFPEPGISDHSPAVCGLAKRGPV